MQHTSDTHHAPGTVIVPASSLARYSEFWLALERLTVPYGTRLVCMRGADIPYQFNEGIRHSDGDWCWFLGDDHTFDPDILMRLLDREKDVVMPVVPRRDPPFVPVLMHGPLGTHMARYNWSELPLTGLFQLPVGDSAGQAGALVKKTVLDQLGDPWFEGGKLTPGRLMEDMYFIKRLHDLHIPIFIDCDLTMGHIANITVKPMVHQGRWYPGYHGPAGPVLWDEPDFHYLPAGTRIV